MHLCGETATQIVQEPEEGEQFISPRLDRIIAMDIQDPQSLVSSVANTKWNLNEECIAVYGSVMEEHYMKIRSLGSRLLDSSVHRM